MAVADGLTFTIGQITWTTGVGGSFVAPVEEAQNRSEPTTLAPASTTPASTTPTCSTPSIGSALESLKPYLW